MFIAVSIIRLACLEKKASNCVPIYTASHPITSVLIFTAVKVSVFTRLGNCCEVITTSTIL
jgi:hypothetical protein